MPHSFWRGELIVIERSDGTADIYSWEPEGRYGHYTWLGDYSSTDEAERYVREMEALPEFPVISSITTAVRQPSAPKLVTTLPRDASQRPASHRVATQRNISK